MTSKAHAKKGYLYYVEMAKKHAVYVDRTHDLQISNDD